MARLKFWLPAARDGHGVFLSVKPSGKPGVDAVEDVERRPIEAYAKAPQAMNAQRRLRPRRVWLTSARPTIQGAKRFYAAMAFAALSLSSTGHARADACPLFPPVGAAKGVTFYTDEHGSKADPKLEAENDNLNKSITDFLRYAETAADGAFDRAPTPALGCAFRTFDAWASADALLEKAATRQAATRQAAIDQVGFVAALDVLALKFKAEGLVLTAAELSWLDRLNRPVIDGSRRSSTRTNLYSWIGFGAAAYALVSGDEDAKQFQNAVWRFAVSAIDPRGYIGTEVSRGGRALIYHQFGLSALLMLREARRKLRIEDKAGDEQALTRLSD